MMPHNEYKNAKNPARVLPLWVCANRHSTNESAMLRLPTTAARLFDTDYVITVVHKKGKT